MHGQAPDNSQHTQQKHIHVAGAIGTENHIKRMTADRRATVISNGVCYKAQLNVYSTYAIPSVPRYVQLSTVNRCSDILQKQI
jgi:hypothetical protein